MKREQKIQLIRDERVLLESAINQLIQDKIKHIPIASPTLMPYGWRKAGKGRTVWRIIEEVISQTLEKHAHEYGFKWVIPASSEVGVYDFQFELMPEITSYVNIKSAVVNGRVNKDDISKAVGLIDFLEENVDSPLYIATFLISFTDEMTIKLEQCIVCPTTWIPDIYVNPSNNGNLQSSKYKNTDELVERTHEEFLADLKEENRIAKLGGRTKLKKHITKQLQEGKTYEEIGEMVQLSKSQLQEMVN